MYFSKRKLCKVVTVVILVNMLFFWHGKTEARVIGLKMLENKSAAFESFSKGSTPSSQSSGCTNGHINNGSPCPIGGGGG